MPLGNHRIVSIGEVLWDLFPAGPRFGGAPANFACHAAALGAAVSLASAVGDDARGREAVAVLRAYCVDASLVGRVAGAPTGTVGVALDALGKPTFEIHENAAWDRIAWTPELGTRIEGAGAVYFGTLGRRAEPSGATVARALAVAEARGVRRVLDVNLRAPFFDARLIRESVERASVLKLGDDEFPDVARACGVAPSGDPLDALRALRARYGLDLVAMTRGARGAVLVSAVETVDQPGIPVAVRDTVGAGDAFAAALVVGLLRGDPLPKIARAACELAAAVCAHPGAVPDLPAPAPA